MENKDFSNMKMVANYLRGRIHFIHKDGEEYALWFSEETIRKVIEHLKKK